AGLRTTSRYRGRSCRIQGDTGAIYGPLTGEILRSNNADAFASINNKRVDILGIDRKRLRFDAPYLNH
ncbi:MAG: hypothetical protein WB005_08725, partial [Pseudolabrys sp.]